MKDSFQRTIDYLRISLTDRCNLRCSYCMPEEGVRMAAHSEILSLEEVLRVSELMSGLGINKIRLTGGEPLLRKNVAWLVEGLKKIPQNPKVAMTTNGVLLAEKLPELRQAGLDEVNISLDSLDRAGYAKICREDRLMDVLKGIDAAYEAGLSVKINCVPVAELNKDELSGLALLSKDRNIDVRFIELMPLGMGRQFTGISSDTVRNELIKSFGACIPEENEKAVADYVRFPGFKGRTGFIRPISHAFCKSCNRVRLTSMGFLKLCLAYSDGVDLREYLRNGSDNEKIKEAIINKLAEKPAGHSFNDHAADVASVHKNEEAGMNSIGG